MAGWFSRSFEAALGKGEAGAEMAPQRCSVVLPSERHSSYCRSDPPQPSPPAWRAGQREPRAEERQRRSGAEQRKKRSAARAGRARKRENGEERAALGEEIQKRFGGVSRAEEDEEIRLEGSRQRAGLRVGAGAASQGAFWLAAALVVSVRLGRGSGRGGQRAMRSSWDSQRHSARDSFAGFFPCGGERGGRGRSAGVEKLGRQLGNGTGAEERSPFRRPWSARERTRATRPRTRR